MKNKNTIYIFGAIIFLCLLLPQLKVLYNNNQTEFYRTEEVAKLDDPEIQRDEEGRIFISNPFKPDFKPEAEKVRKELEENPTYKPEEDTENTSLQESIAVENAITGGSNNKYIEELMSAGSTQMQEMMDEKVRIQQEIEAKRKAEEEKKQQEQIRSMINELTTGVDDLRTPSNLTASQLEKGLRKNLSGLGSYFIEAEKTYGVNAIFLASVAALESAWGTSNYAVKRNNLFGYGAYTSNPDNAYYFSSKRVAILYVARKLRVDYLSENGKFFSGYTLEGVNKRYCTNPQWAKLVGNIMKDMYKDIKK